MPLKRRCTEKHQAVAPKLAMNILMVKTPHRGRQPDHSRPIDARSLWVPGLGIPIRGGDIVTTANGACAAIYAVPRKINRAN